MGVPFHNDFRIQIQRALFGCALQFIKDRHTSAMCLGYCSTHKEGEIIICVKVILS